ncbi:hypothetical protein ACUY3K_05855 [Corynebacterium uberis]|uniref:hypothetical protein n=1 Tax=Corynebacterium TaxID=1716 RepID=UPI001D0B4021|nr:MULTISPECIES: hypothetical protein [Corynebacterium]MCZ9308220.1 hypothetical protein [Corynebacterium sp. c6VSa_13]UDL73901.1 hypothetical protein LH391_01325 [Corynebacterium uberis]UDL75216.1 hypothetical protein LH393_08090 [Corynebacterium uberis]UDL77427.1 hypothetical protein LH394_08070 [Corynebacterium uberis]UDL79712.1 hypothetical protein LH392_08495 [Corynebacterium uberis]
MKHNRILITAPVTTRAEFFSELAHATYEPGRQAPRTLDGMADLLKEFQVRTIICANWSLPAADAAAIRRVLSDLSVALKR